MYRTNTNSNAGEMAQHRRSRTLGLALLSAIGSMILFATSAKANDEDVSPRIVGGTDASPGQYQFFASWAGSCGATLIHDDILLTAAHCLEVSSDLVTVGAYTRGEFSEPSPVNSVTRTVVERLPHPSFTFDTWEFDFMLLKINKRVTHLPTIELNSDPDFPPVGSAVTVLGLGRLGEEETVASILQQVTVEVIDSNTCNSSPMYEGWIADSNLCAGYASGQLDACFGDSGGPLIADVDGVWKQMGTVSYGTGCARENKPGVYGRVSAGYEWIWENVCLLSSYPPSWCPSARTVQYPLLSFQKNPPPTDRFPLGVCEGDCDYDTDCDEGLFCFQRRTGEWLNVPGCGGEAAYSIDYCIWEEYRSFSDAAVDGRTIAIPQNGLIPSNQTSLLLSDIPTSSPSASPNRTRNLRSRI